MFDPAFYLKPGNSAYASELQRIRLLARPSGRDDHVVLNRKWVPRTPVCCTAWTSEHTNFRLKGVGSSRCVSMFRDGSELRLGVGVRF